MSLRDEKVASMYLHRRGPYRRPRSRCFAVSLLIGFALCGFFLVRCEARTINIQVTGLLEQWENQWVYARWVPWYAGLWPFRMEWLVDENAMDENPDPTIGVYSGSLTMTYEFGPYVDYGTGPFKIEQPGCKVTIYAGNSGFYGFAFSNRDQFTRFGVTHPADTGVFAMYVQPFYNVCPTDELHWVVTNCNHWANQYNMHAWTNGFFGGTTFVHSEPDNSCLPFIAEYQ